MHNDKENVEGIEECEDGMGCSGLIPGFEEKERERRKKQMDINFKFVMNAINQIHDNICPGQFGTWQDRVNQAVDASKKLNGEIRSNSVVGQK